MKKRVLSFLLTLCLLVNSFPMQVLAEEWTAVEETAAEPAEIVEPADAPEEPPAADLVLPLNNGAGADLLGLESDPDTVYLYPGMDEIWFSDLYLPGVTSAPTDDLFLRAVDSQGKPAFDAGIISCRPEDGMFMQWGDRWYLTNVEFTGLRNVEPGVYTLELIPMVASSEGGIEVIRLNQTITVLPADSLLVDGFFVEGFYSGVESFEAWLFLYGFEEEDLGKLALTMTDDEGEVVARTDGSPGILTYYQEENGGMDLRLRMVVEEGAVLDADSWYQLSLNFSGDKDVYCSRASVNVGVSMDPVIRSAWISNAQDAAITVDVDNFDPAAIFDIRIFSDNYGLVASYQGKLPADGVLELPLGESRGQCIMDYGDQFYVVTEWTLDDSFGRIGTYYLWSPYMKLYEGDVGMTPKLELDSVESFPFTLRVPASMGILTEPVVELVQSDGRVAGTASGISVSRSEGLTCITGTMTQSGIRAGEQVSVTVDGKIAGQMRMEYEESSSWSVEWPGLKANFGEMPMSAQYFNGPETLEFQLRDMDGNVVLTSGEVNPVPGVTPSYHLFEYAFTEEQLLESLQPGEVYAFGIYRPDQDYFRNVRSSVFETEVQIDGNLYFSKSPRVGDQTLELELDLWACWNITTEALLDTIELRYEVLDESGVIVEIGQTAIAELELVEWETVDTVRLRATLEQPLQAKNYRLYCNNRQTDYAGLLYQVPGTYQCNLRQGYVMGENLPLDGKYTCKVYDGYEACLELDLELEDGREQYLYFDTAETMKLPNGNYYMRYYRDGELLCTGEAVVAFAEDALIRVGSSWDNTSLLLKTPTVYVNYDYRGKYEYARAAFSLEELEWSNYINLRQITGSSRSLHDYTDGPATFYVELSTDLTGTDKVIREFNLYLCTDGDYDLQTTAEESILVAVGGSDYELQATTEHPYARVWAEFTDSVGNTASVELTKKGLQTTDGRCLFSLTIPADIEALIPGSDMTYSSAVSVTLWASDLDSDDPVGAAVQRSFSLRTMDAVYIYGLEGDRLTLGKDDSLRGVANPNSTLTVKIRSEETGKERVFSVSTDAAGLFTLTRQQIDSEAAVITITDAALGSVEFRLTVDSQPPVVTGHLDTTTSGNVLLAWSCEDSDVVAYRVYRGKELLAELAADVRMYNTDYPAGGGVLYLLQAEDAAGNMTEVELPDAVNVNDQLSYVWNDITGELRFFGSGPIDSDFNRYGGFSNYEIRSLILPEGITAIEDYTFSDSSIARVEIPSTVEYLGDYAFGWNFNLQTVILHEGLKNIGNAFSQCEALTSIHLPASVESVDHYAFDYCYALSAFTVAEGSEYFSAVDGVLYSADGKTLVRYPIGKTDSSFTVPGTVVRIGPKTFDGSVLTTITVSEGVTEIDYGVFEDCTNLTTIYLPASLSFINNSVFIMCPSLDQIVLAEGNEHYLVENGCLYSSDRQSLYTCFDKDGVTAWTAPENTWNISEGAFSCNTALQTVVLPTGMDYLGYRTFYGCTSLREITIPSSMQRLNYAVFDQCPNLETVIYGGSEEMWQRLQNNSDSGNDALWNAEEMVYQADYATSGECGWDLTWSFNEETGLLTIEGSGDMYWYNSASEVPWHIFADKITAVSLPEGLTGLGNFAFSDCAGLVEVELPSQLYGIGSCAFQNCASLTGITLPESLSYIDNDAFRNCTSLTDIHLPANVWSLGTSVFGGCTGLTRITVDENNYSYYVEDDALLTLASDGNLLYYFGSSTDYVVPEHVRQIDPFAFAYNKTLQSVRLQDAVWSIGWRAFTGCDNLRLVRLPASITRCDYGAFEDCGSLETVTYGGTESMWQRLAAGLEDTDNDDLLNAEIICSQITVVNGTLGEDLTWSLDLTNGAMTISGTGWSDYYSQDNNPWAPYMPEIRTVVVEEGVRCLFDYAFYGASALTSVTLPEGYETLTSLMFAYSGLTSFHFPSTTNLYSSSVFLGCQQLEEITVSENNVHLLTDLDGVLYYDYRVYNDGYQLVAYPNGRTDTVYAIPEGTTGIDSGAFQNNTTLQTLILPEGMTDIGWGLQECYGLTTLEIPGTAHTVDAGYLMVLPELQTVRYAGTQEMWDKLVFYGSEEDVAALNAIVQVSETYVASGKLGDNLTWSFDGNSGLLTIAGEGAMEENLWDFPWVGFGGSVTAVVVDEGVTSLIDGVFCDLNNLTSVSLPETLVRIGYNILGGTSVTELRIPAATVEIYGEAFVFCHTLERIIVDEENERYFSVDGVLYERVESETENGFLICYPAGKTDAAYTVLDGTLEIMASAFRENLFLQEVNLPEGLTFVSIWAFCDCENLATVSLPSTLGHVGYRAFAGTALETARYHGSQQMWQNVYVDSYNDPLLNALQTMPGGSCGNYAYWLFDEQTGTLTVYGEDTVTWTPWALYREEITAIVVEDGIYGLCSDVFAGCTVLTAVSLPDSLEWLESNVFQGCTALTEITIPGSVYSMDSDTFSGCTALKAVHMEAGSSDFVSRDGVVYYETEDYRQLFLYPMGKTDTAFTPDAGTMYIGSYAFRGNPYLQTVALPEGVLTIGEDAFCGCTALTELQLPLTLTEIAEDAFKDTAPTEVVYAGSEYTWQEISIGLGNEALENANRTCLINGESGDCGGLRWNLDNETGLLTIFGSGPIPGGEAFGWLEFADKITAVKLDSGVTAIGSAAFAGLSRLTEVTLSETVTEIGQNAFYGTALTTFHLPATVAAVDPLAFGGCFSLTAITAEEGGSYTAADGVLYSADGSTLITYPLGRIASSFMVPDGVKSIASGAFCGNTMLEALYLPESLLYFDTEALSGTDALRDLYYDGPKLRWEKVELDGANLTDKIMHFTSPEGQFGEMSWQLDGYTGKLTITGEGVMMDMVAGDGWLAYCDCITAVELSEGITDLGQRVLQSCALLTEVTLPESVTYVGNLAFNHCTGLREVNFGRNVSDLGAGIFRDCPALERIVFTADAPEVFMSILCDNSPLAVVYYPLGSFGWGDKWCGLPAESYILDPDINFFPGYDASVVYNQKSGVVLNAGEKLTKAIIPADLGITAIGENAFAACKGLQYVVIPTCVTDIAANAFPAGTTIVAAADSAACAFAEANGLSFRVPTVTLSPADGGSIGGDSGRITAALDVYGALPLELSCGEADLTYTETATEGTDYRDAFRIFELDLTVMTDGEYRFTVANEDYGISAQVRYLVDVTAPAVITGLQATGGDLQIILTWDQAAEANVTKYHIYRADAENGKPVLVKTIADRNTVSWVDTDVVADVPCWYWIAAEDSFGQTGDLSQAATAAAHADLEPPMITSVSPENGKTIAGTLAMLIKARDNIALQSITVELSADQKDWTVLETLYTPESAVFRYDTTQWTEPVLYVRVSAMDESGNVGYGSTIYRYAVDNQGPETVTGLYLKKAQTTILTLEWNDVADDDLYYFRVEQLEGETWVPAGEVYSERGINLRGLTPATAYTFRVSAVDQLGNVGGSAEITAETLADETAPVITDIQPGAGAFHSELEVLVHAADDHKVVRMTLQLSADGGRSWEDLYTVENAAKLYHVLDLTNRAEGLIRLRAVAVDASGNVSDTSEAAPFREYLVDHTAPGAPQGLTASGGDGVILVAWQKASESDIEGYDIYRGESPDGPFTCLRSNAAALSLKDQTVSYDKTYYYYVQARDQAGNLSEKSEIVYAKSLPDGQAPEITSISPSGKDVVMPTVPVRVKAVDNSQLETLFYRWSVDAVSWNDGSVTVTGSETVQTLPINLAELNSDTLHLQVWCADISGHRSAVKEVTYTIDGKAPAVPQLSAALTDEGIVLSWDASTDEDVAGYVIYRKAFGETRWTKLLQRAAGVASYTELDAAIECNKAYSYYVQAVDRCGNESSGEPLADLSVPEDWEGGKDVTAPMAIIVGNLTGTVGIELVFSSRTSWDDREVVAQRWNFGDGASSELPEPAHAYEKAGSYTMSLTVWDEAGNENTATATVQIKEKEALGSVRVQVNDENGHGVAQVGVYFDLGDAGQSIVYTDYSGEAVIHGPIGVHTVGAYKEGYLPAKKDVEILSGVESSVTLVTVQKDLVVGDLTVRRMTLDEIRAAEIDVSDPANQEVFEFKIELTYGTEPLSIKTQVNSQGKPLKDPEPIVLPDGRAELYVGVIPWSNLVGTGGGGTGGSGGGSGEDEKPEVPTVVVMEIPGKASWLKDFFEVKLTVINQADPEFFLDDCRATLRYDEAGLTLMNSNYTTDSDLVEMGSIGGQHSATAYWILRGDKAGAYDLEADFSAVLRDFNADVSARFKTKEPFQVRQNAGLSLELEVENGLLEGTDGALRIGLRNDHAEPYYLPNIELDQDLVYLRKSYKKIGYKELTAAETDMEVLNSGETLCYEYIVPRANWETLTARHGEKFYLHSAVVKAIGGTTELPVNVTELPPCVLSADKIEVKQRTASGTEIPVNLISLDKDYGVKVSGFPTLVIYTYALQEDGTYEPADMNVTVTDPLAKNGKDGLTPKWEDTGVYVYEQGDAWVLDNDKSCTIRITASRPMSDGKSYSRCKPVEIPVSVLGATAKLGDITVSVYGMDENGVTAPLVGAQFIFSSGNRFHNVEDKDGRVLVTNIPEGYQEISVSKHGYMSTTKVIEVTDGGEYAFTLLPDPDPGKSKVLSVGNSLMGYSTGNVTIIPEGGATGSVYFTPIRQMEGRDRFVCYRGRIVSDGQVKETADFTTDSGFPVQLEDLVAGDRIQFAVVYESEMTHKQEVSKFTDSGVIVVSPPNFWDNLMFSASDIMNKVKLNSGKTMDLDLTSIGEVFEIDDLGFGKNLKSDDKSATAATQKIDEGGVGRSERKDTFPLAVTYEPSGKLVCSLIFGGTSDYGTDEGKISGRVFSGTFKQSKAVNHGERLFVDLILQYSPATDGWDFIIRGGILLNQEFLVGKMEFYKVAYVSMKLEFEEELGWKVVERHVDALTPEAVWDLCLELDKLAGSFGTKVAAGVQAFSDDWASAGIYVRGKVNMRLIPAARVEAEGAIGGEYNFLWLGNSKDWVTDAWTLYPMGGDYSLRDAFLQSDQPLTVTAMPKNVVNLMNSDPDLFADNTYADADARLIRLPDGRVMMVWLDLTGDTNNPATIRASVLSDGGWTDLGVLDPDGTPDLLPGLIPTETGAVAVWTDATTDLSQMQNVSYDDLAQRMPEMLGVSAAFYDAAANSWSEPVSLTTGTAANEPVVVSSGSRTMVAWIANDGSLNHSDVTPEYIGWALLENGEPVSGGRLDAAGRNLAELKLGSYYGQFRLAVLGDDGTVRKAYTAAYEGSGWTELTRVNKIDANDSVMTYGADGALYVLNNGRILRDRGGSAVQVLSHDLLSDATRNLTAAETEQGTVLTWTTTLDGEHLVCMSLVKDSGTASDPVVILRGGEGLVKSTGAAVCNGGVMVAATVGREETLADGATGLVYSLTTPVISMQPDLVLEQGSVEHHGVLYAGSDIVTSVQPTNRGLGAADGFTMTIARSADGSDAVASGEFPGQDSAALRWTVPDTYAGEPLYLVVTPMSGADRNMADNAAVLDNVIREAALKNLTYTGKADGRDTFLVTVENLGRSVMEQVDVTLQTLAEVGEDVILTTETVDRLEPGESRTILLTSDSPVGQNEHLMASLEQLVNETDFSDNRAYLSMETQYVEPEGILILQTGWFNADGETVGNLTGSPVTYRVELENLGVEAEDVQLMAACYDSNGRFLRVVCGSVTVDGQGTAVAEVSLTARQLAFADTVKAFLLDGAQTLMCPAEELER
ncbi:MAG: leucine-rich repeat protein [Clostridia bacterium]|nr:leucine-rich repeat protein [Clostridia bacterium]